MSDFREVCIATDTVPKQWSGAGWIAASLLKKHGIPKRPLTAKEAALLADAGGSGTQRTTKGVAYAAQGGCLKR
jgi:hypothetical protein